MRIKRMILLLALAFGLHPVIQTEVIAKDLVVQSYELGGGKHIHYLHVDLAEFNVRVLTPLVPLSTGLPTAFNPERMPQGLLLADYQARFSALAVISGGYIATYSPPTALGFVKSNGIPTAPPHDSWLTNGVFCSDIGRAIIQASRTTADQSNFRDCLQAGPLLLSGGNLLTQTGISYQKLANSVQEQTFICIDSQKRILLGVSDKISLASLFSFLVLPEIRCIDALRLTGLDTSGLRDRSSLYGHDDYLFPSAIGVLQRIK